MEMKEVDCTWAISLQVETNQLEFQMPSSLERCRENCEQFLRNTLPSFRTIEPTLPVIPKFSVVHDPGRKRMRFAEHGQPNWWQVPKDLWTDAFKTESGQAVLNSLESTAPFRDVIGKSMHLVESGRGIGGIDREYIAKEISRSYLFEAATGPWRPHAFERVWNQCVDYFDPSEAELTWVLYAPIWGLRGISRSLSLGDGLEIRNLTTARQARIASLDSTLSGVNIEHRLTLWPSHFFVKEFKVQKIFDSDGQSNEIQINRSHEMAVRKTDVYSALNEEVVLLRALLGNEATVPHFAFIYDGYPRDPGGGQYNTFPWRPRLSHRDHRTTRAEIDRYASKRARFKELSGEPGWGAVMASMRRYAIAWDSPYPADSLSDIVSALEGLLLQGKRTETERTLKERAANILTTNETERQVIRKNIKDAYELRSRIAHGGFVFDTYSEIETARAMKSVGTRRQARQRDNSLIKKLQEVQRLKGVLANYYGSALGKLISSGTLKVD